MPSVQQERIDAQCPRCPRVLATAQGLRRHLRTVHNVVEPLRRCKRCKLVKNAERDFAELRRRGVLEGQPCDGASPVALPPKGRAVAIWVLTDRGFYSAVQSKTNSDQIVVRARVREDLVALVKLVPRKVPIQGRATDYPHRVVLSRDEWNAALQQLSESIDYTNFKDSVTARQGAKRHDVYMRIWGVLRGLEHGGRRRRGGDLPMSLFERTDR